MEPRWLVMMACVAATSAAALRAGAPKAPSVRIVVAPPSTLVAPVASHGFAQHGMPHPDVHRASGFDPIAQNAACVDCHAEIAAEWRTSLHRASATDPIYLRGFAREPLPMCRECHAPEAPDGDGPDLALRTSLGVGCVTCHVVFGDAPLSSSTTGGAPHAVTVNASFGTAAACAGCHEFRFPDESAVSTSLMQSTMSEHAASPRSKESCASCHMPTIVEKGRAHRSHGFAVSDSMLKSAVRVLPCRPSRDRARITLLPGELGHAFPTGDIFRRLALRVSYGNVSVVQNLERHAFPRAFDTRVQADGNVVVELETEGVPADAPLSWSLEYQIAERAEGDALTIARSVKLASDDLRVASCP